MEAREYVSKPIMLVVIAAAVIAVAAYWSSGLDGGEVEDGQNKAHIPGSNLFRLSYSPAGVKVKEKAEVVITVMPEPGFSDSLSFRVDDVLQGITSVKDKNILAASFSSSTLKAEDFAKGITLLLQASKSAAKGLYVIAFTVKTRNVERAYVFPVSLE